MKWMARKNRVERVNVIAVDEILGPWDESVPYYWRARVPKDEMKAINPYNFGLYKINKETERLAAWLAIPSMSGFFVGAIAFLLTPKASWSVAISTSFMVAVGVAILIGLPAAKLVVAKALQTEIHYVLGRMPEAMANQLGLKPDHGYMPIWATPPPLLTGEEGDAAIIEETDVTLWRMDMLMRGEGGWSTENFKDVAIAEQYRRNDRNRQQSDIPPPVSIDRASPGDTSGIPIPGGH